MLLGDYKLFQLIFGPVGSGQQSKYYRQLVISLVAECRHLLANCIADAINSYWPPVFQRQRLAADRANPGCWGNPGGRRDRQECSQQAWLP